MKTVQTQIKETKLKETVLGISFKLILIVYVITNFSGVYTLDEQSNKMVDYLQIVNILCGLVAILIVSKVRIFNKKVSNISVAVIRLSIDGIIINYKSFGDKDRELEISRDELNKATITIDDCGLNIVTEKYSCRDRDGKNIIHTNAVDITIIDNWGIIRELINSLQSEAGLFTFKANNLRDKLPC